MTDLLARLEQAEEDSRELDAAVYNAYPEEDRIAIRLPIEQWNGRFDDGWYTKWRDREDKYPEKLDHYTKSLDAKLPWENIIKVEWNANTLRWDAVHMEEDRSIFYGTAKTEVLARRIAALRARA